VRRVVGDRPKWARTGSAALVAATLVVGPAAPAWADAPITRGDPRGLPSAGEAHAVVAPRPDAHAPRPRPVRAVPPLNSAPSRPAGGAGTEGAEGGSEHDPHPCTAAGCCEPAVGHGDDASAPGAANEAEASAPSHDDSHVGVGTSQRGKDDDGGKDGKGEGQEDCPPVTTVPEAPFAALIPVPAVALLAILVVRRRSRRNRATDAGVTA